MEGGAVIIAVSWAARANIKASDLARYVVL
jgi:hypothetical protein